MVHTLKGQIFDVVEVTNLLLVSKIPTEKGIRFKLQHEPAIYYVKYVLIGNRYFQIKK